MSIIDLLVSIQRRKKKRDARKNDCEKRLEKAVKARVRAADAASVQARAPENANQIATSRSVLPKAPGAPARANFGTLKPRTFGRGPTRR